MGTCTHTEWCMVIGSSVRSPLRNATKCGRSANKRGKHAGIRPSHVKTGGTVTQSRIVVDASLSALCRTPPLVSKLCRFGLQAFVCTVLASISCGKPWQGMIIPGTKVVD